MSAPVKSYDSIVAFLKYGRGITSFLICIVISSSLFNLNLVQKKTFFDISISTFLAPAQKVLMWMEGIKDLQAENVVLKEEKARLRLENDLLIEAKIENVRLKDFLSFKQTEEYPLIFAQVIARDPGRLHSSCVIDVGSKDSIEVNMPVFTANGVVGKVFKVFNSHSYVQFLNDPASKVSAIENRSRTIGVLQTVDSYTIELAVPNYADVRVGDTLVTSGYGGIFPKGMRLGVITGFISGDIELMKKAEVALFQSPAYVEEVFVLKKESDWVFKGGK
ncbi:MAG: rod shape-determining protein MreC [Fibrobacterales bacterium]